MKKQIIHFGITFVTIFLILSCQLWAGTTGKIAGNVTDAQSGDPLPGANIFIDGTTMGSATDLNGNYTIVHVPPGTYTLRVSMIGYQQMRFENVQVSIDLTTKIDIQLGTEVVELGNEVTIVAERPLVTKDLTATTAVVGAEEMASLPVTEVNDAIELQAGLVKDAGGGFHIRGGRTGEVSYWIDGIPITDVYNGGAVVDVSKDMVQELQVVSGAFNAEYGQAMSGIVNIATKSGSNDFGGSFTTYFGDHISNNTKQFMNIDKIDPIAIHNFDGSVHGAVIKDKLFYYLNSRYIYFDGWLDGQRRFKPNSVVNIQRQPAEIVEKYAPEYLEQSVVVDENKNTLGFPYIVGTNAYLDSIITDENMPTELRNHPNPDSAKYYFQQYYNSLRENNKDGKGDNKIIPMNWSEKIYAQGKLIYKPIPSLTFAYNFIYDDVDYQEWGIDNERNYKYNPDGAPKKFNLGISNIVKVTHLLTSNTFYELGFSYFSKEFNKYNYNNNNDPRYVQSGLGVSDAYSYKTGGLEDTYQDPNNPLFKPRFERKTETVVGKFDITSQLTFTHQLKAGMEFRQHQVFWHDYLLSTNVSITNPLIRTTDPIFVGPYVETEILAEETIYNSSYTHKPIELSAYLQDKMEFSNMIVNLGVRFDYFDPDGVVLADLYDPTITYPRKAENRYHDWGTDGIPNSYDADGTENNGRQDANEPLVTLKERQQYWYKDAPSNMQLSPRFGVSFPITDRGVIHFSYGHFFQIPRFERLYQNPDFELGFGTGNVGVIGNAALKPEQTVSGEIGIQQQLTDDISLSATGYFRDIRNLTGTRSDAIMLESGVSYSRFTNSDFGIVKGFIIALDKKFSGGLSASFDYTLQVTKGSGSDPEQARNALAGGAFPEVQLTPLDWDQKHTVNGTVSYSGNGWGGSMIAQWGSGLPYTPRKSEDITALLNNSEKKPVYYNVDLRAYKDIKLSIGTLTLFTRIFNLFDTLNEINVYDDTGRAGFTIDEQKVRSTNPDEIINSLDDWFINPTFYSEPRRIEVGVTYTF